MTETKNQSDNRFNQAVCFPSIAFPGTCNEAITFYKEAFGAEVKVINYFGDVSQDTDTSMDKSTPSNFVLYSEVVLFGVTFCMTDIEEGKGITDTKNYNFWFSIFCHSQEEVTAIYNKLIDGGGEIVLPLRPEYWATLNANVNDRFGAHWSIFTTN